MPRWDETIAFDRLHEGIGIALDRATALVEDAAILVSRDRKLGGAILFSQGAEELGKAAMLRDALTCGGPDPNGMVVVKGFLHHPSKLRRAFDLLALYGEDAADALLTCSDFYDADAYFDADIKYGDRVSAADDRTRQEWFYTSWDRDAGAWREIPAVNLGLTSARINWLVAFITERRREWCPSSGPAQAPRVVPSP